MRKNDVLIPFKLSEDEREKLEMLGRRSGLQLGEVLRILAMQMLRRLEDVELERIVERRRRAVSSAQVIGHRNALRELRPKRRLKE